LIKFRGQEFGWNVVDNKSKKQKNLTPKEPEQNLNSKTQDKGNI
jgi:hypothetical protein